MGTAAEMTLKVVNVEIGCMAHRAVQVLVLGLLLPYLRFVRVTVEMVPPLAQIYKFAAKFAKL